MGDKGQQHLLNVDQSNISSNIIVLVFSGIGCRVTQVRENAATGNSNGNELSTYRFTVFLTFLDIDAVYSPTSGVLLLVAEAM